VEAEAEEEVDRPTDVVFGPPIKRPRINTQYSAFGRSSVHDESTVLYGGHKIVLRKDLPVRSLF
jgi:hypothetical protein